MSRKVLCLDWDKRSLRMVVARAGAGTVKLEDAHSHRLPSAVNADDPASMGGFISQMLKRHRWHYKRVIVDVPRDQAVINRLALAPTPTSEVAAAVHFQAVKELPFPLDEAVIDFAIMQRDANKCATEVLLAAVRIEALARLRETCNAAGLTPARIGLRPYANLVSITHLPGLADKRVLFVDVGPTMTEIDVIRGSQLAFSRSANVTIPFRPYELTPTDDSRVSSKAELLDIHNADEGVEVAVAELALEIVRTLQAFRATEPTATIDQIVIAGGTAIEHELVAAVEKRLGLPTMLFDPTGPLRVPASQSLKLRPFAAALGLAWGLSQEGLLELDFLNPKKPIARGVTFKRRLRAIGFGAAAVVALLVAGGAWYFRGKSLELRGLQADVNKLREELKQARELGNRVAEVDDWATEAVWLDHLAVIIENLIEPGKQMIVRQIKFEDPSSAITLELYCRDFATFDQFIQKLNQIRANNKPVYLAEMQGTWNEGSTGDPGFEGMAKVQIRLLDLERFKSAVAVKKREKDRRDRLTSF